MSRCHSAEMSSRRLGRPTVYAPTLLDFRWMAAIAVASAATTVWLAYVSFDVLVPAAPPRATGPSSATTRSIELAKLAIAVAGFVGAVLAGVYAYRRQRLAEGDARRADAEQLGARFAQASEQLGHTSPAVRLAGVYALAELADEWEARRQTCVNVLTAYLQVPWIWDPDDDDYQVGEHEVRRTIFRVIRDHLRDDMPYVSWRGLNFRFEGAIVNGGDLTGARFTNPPGSSTSATPRRAHVTFHGARFVGGVFHFHVAIEGADVWFQKARFEGGEVHFQGASITSGGLHFKGATEAGGQVLFTGFRNQGGKIEPGPFADRIPQPEPQQ